tara:strand:- start:349 stop:570 length:222 start_codon:yes stop_codon:yes gene_type:complete
MLAFEKRFEMEQEEKKKKEDEIIRVKRVEEEKKKPEPVQKKISKPVDIPPPRKPKIPDYIKNLPPSLRKMYGY